MNLTTLSDFSGNKKFLLINDIKVFTCP